MRFSELCAFVHRTLYIQATFNYERMQALGFCNCLIPFIRRHLHDPEARRRFLNRHMMFFNSHPYMVGWIIGAVIHLEEQLLKNEAKEEDIIRYKRIFSQTISAVGDSLFWGSLKPVTIMIGLLVSLYDMFAGLLLFVTLYNLPHLYFRFHGIVAGYEKGLAAIKDVSLGRYKGLISRVGMVGSFLSGLLLGPLASTMAFFSTGEVVAFVGGAAAMFVSVRRGISIPWSLVAFSLVSFLVGIVMTLF
jgi:PTS system mannose-specific IID component